MQSIRLLPISFIFILYVIQTTATGTNTIAKRSTTTNLVDIAMFTDSSAPGKTFSVYVDSTMTRLIVEVKVDRSDPVILLSKPSGSPGPLPVLNGTASAGAVTATIDATITATDYGIWKLMKLDANTWNVTVQGESPLDFSCQFLEGTFIQVPITGDPIQEYSYSPCQQTTATQIQADGAPQFIEMMNLLREKCETYKTVITVPEYDKMKKIDVVMLFVTEKSAPANKMFPTDKGGGVYEVASLKMLDKDFMIGIQGNDSSGKVFRRIIVIKPIASTLSVPSFAGAKLYENTKLDIPFSVVNKLSTDQDIDVRIQDTQGFAEAPQFLFHSFKPGENFTGKFVIKGGLLGVTTIVTITANHYLGNGKFSHGPSEVRQFTVERNHNTQGTAAVSSNQPTGMTRSDATSIRTPSLHHASTASVSALPSTLTEKVSTIQASASVKSLTAASVSNAPSTVKSVSVSTTHAPASAKSVSAASGTSSNAPTTIKSASATKSKVSTGPLHVKSTILPVTQHAAVSALSSSSKAAGQTTTTTSDGGKDGTFSKGEIFGAAIVSGVSAGVLIGVAALVTMGLVFKHSINKGKVTPDKKKQKMLSEENELAWT